MTDHPDLSLETTHAVAGQEASTVLTLSPGAPVAAADFTVTYDPAVFSCLSVTAGEAVSQNGGMVVINPNYHQGVIRFSYINESGYDGGLELLRIRWKVLSSPSAHYRLIPGGAGVVDTSYHTVMLEMIEDSACIYEAYQMSPTCTARGEEGFRCNACADSYDVVYSDALGHNYEVTIEDPTCTEPGYLIHTCSRCGDAFSDVFTEALGHTVEDGICIVCDTPVGMAEGTCGDGVLWSLSESGRLTIYGSGAMQNFYSTNMPWYAYIDRITALVVREGVTYIGDYAFYRHKALASVSLPDSLEAFGANAFADCESLLRVTIPDGITYLPDYLFYSCDALAEIDLPESLQTIGTFAVGSCRALKDIRIPDSLISLRDYAFAFTGLVDVVLPDGLTTIGNNAFRSCSGMKTITIPETTTSIGKSALPAEVLVFCCQGSAAYVYAQENGLSFCAAPAGKMLGHSYTAVVTDPTCTGQGYTTHTCDWCRDSHVDSYTDELGHDFGEWYTVLEATCTEEGEEQHDCSRCEAFEVCPTPVLGHSYQDGICTRCGAEENASGPQIVSQPSDYVGMVGDTVTFTVVAEGENLSYQWYYFDIPADAWKKASGGNTATLTVEFKSYRNNQQYRCEITDADGNTVTTNAAKLTAKAMDLVIVTQPVSYVNSVNDDVTFSLKATGNGLTYQWYYSDDSGITWLQSGTPGCLTDTLLPILRNYRDGYLYKCVITDVYGNVVTSDIVSMTVKSSEVTIHSQPADVDNGILNQLHTFKVSASGVNLEYRWEYSDDGGATWQNSWNEGYLTDTLTVRLYDYRDGYLYRCKLTSGLKNTVYTNAVELNLQAPSATIVKQPVNVAAVSGKPIQFRVEATGTNLTYQWHRSNDNGATWVLTYMDGYNTDTLHFNATNARAALYMCKITDGSGKIVWTNVVKLQILSAELQILSQPESVICATGATAAFKVEAQGDSLKYQWYSSADGGETWTKTWLGGYNTDTLSFVVNAGRAAKIYKCVITDAAGNTVTSHEVSIYVKA